MKKNNDNSNLRVLRKEENWETRYFYRKTVVLYQMTVVFCERFLPKYGDRTVDQMVQAARSGKQNIVEGLADGVTSMELKLKLLNVARASLKELREDYQDHITRRHLCLWDSDHPRYDKMLDFCRYHNDLKDYEPFFTKWDEECFCNCAITLCHMVDKMLMNYMEEEALDFKENGGIREQMTRVRLGFRATQKEEITDLKVQLSQHQQQIRQQQSLINQLQQEIARLTKENEELKGKS